MKTKKYGDMDIIIEKKKGFGVLLTKRFIPYWVGLLIVLLVLWMFLRDNASSLRVDAKTVTIVSVQKGEFNDYVRVSGQVQPITTVQVSPLEGGIVEKMVVEEGAKVKHGDVIVVLSNNNLNLSILESEAQLAEKQNFLRNTLIAMEQEKLNLKQEKLQLDLDVQRKKRGYQQKEELYKSKLIAKEEYLLAKEDYELADKKRILVKERQVQDSLYRTIQVQQMKESLDNMRRNMLLIRERVANLRVKSPIDGEIGQLDAVLGQSVAMGQRLGQINDLSDFKIEAMIDEHYIDRVRQNLMATFERQGDTFTVNLRKVYPDVRNGQFKADFYFTGVRPSNIRIGQTYYLNLQLGQSSEAIIIPRGSFYQHTGGTWIYVLSEDGSKAYKREIQIGRQNPQYYEVISGLKHGEKVVVSSYETFGKNDMLILK